MVFNCELVYSTFNRHVKIRDCSLAFPLQNTTITTTNYTITTTNNTITTTNNTITTTNNTITTTTSLVLLLLL